MGQAKVKESEESKSADLVLVASAFERDPWPGSLQEIMKVTVPFLSMIMESDPLSVRFFFKQLLDNFIIRLSIFSRKTQKSFCSKI